MSVTTQLTDPNPNYLWILASLPLALGIDLAIGNIVGRSYPVIWLRRLIEVAEQAVLRTVARLGGGRGGDLFGGIILLIMVVGSVSSLVWMVIEVGDAIGELGSLLVRATVIAAGLAVRSTGDQILSAAEATDQPNAGQWLAAVGGRVPRQLDQLGVHRVCVAVAGEVLSSVIVAPLCWLAVGGPAAMWGYLAIRSLRETMLARRNQADLAGAVAIIAADLAEAIPAVLTWLLIVVAAGVIRADPRQAWAVGWRTGRGQPRLVPIWGQAAMAGGLGIQVAGGRTFSARTGEAHPWVGTATQNLDALTVVRSVRIMQIAALMAAGLAVLVTIIW